ncbi:MAG: 4'-phosphopantetheinyl transferase superfamily protein [Steroidobacteraceae bacterium]|nr:4'-phosphopantetheinyl transferase superfamily protein [Steroidobacteraceae bacterium]
MASRTDLLELPQDAVDVWLAFTEEMPSAELLARYRKLLTPEERARGERFHFEHLRQQYLVTRALVRTVLSRYASPAPDEWRFSVTKYGRPEIASPTVLPALAFNLSHTKGIVVCAVGRSRELGVDVERLRFDRDLVPLAARYFAEDEVRELNALPPSQQHVRFFEYWTLKESYIKARGEGLSIPLDRFSFALSLQPSTLAFRPEPGDSPSRWQFQLLRPSPDYLLALCAQLEWAAPMRVTVRQVVPLSQEWQRPCEVLRRAPEFSARSRS